MCLVGAQVAWADVTGKEVSYKAGGVIMKGYLAYNAEADRSSWEDAKKFLAEAFAGK